MKSSEVVHNAVESVGVKKVAAAMNASLRPYCSAPTARATVWANEPRNEPVAACVIVPASDMPARMKCDVAVAICTGKSSR